MEMYKNSPPKRIQKERGKDWRMPPNSVYVGGRSFFGDPYHNPTTFALALHDRTLDHRFFKGENHIKYSIQHIHDELFGKDLVCWCALGSPCHADVLLTVANHWNDGRIAIRDDAGSLVIMKYFLSYELTPLEPPKRYQHAQKEIK